MKTLSFGINQINRSHHFHLIDTLTCHSKACSLLYTIHTNNHMTMEMSVCGCVQIKTISKQAREHCFACVCPCVGKRARVYVYLFVRP